MARLFDPDSMAWKPFGWLGDLLILSMLWFLCSVPLVTTGAATTALYDAAVRSFRHGDKDTLGRFLRTFKKEFKTATLTTLLWGAVLALCYLAVYFYGNLAGVTQLSTALTIAGLVLVAVVLGFPCWAFAALSRFTFSTQALNSTAAKLALSKLPATALMGLATVLAGWLCLRFIVPIFVAPCLVVLFWSLFTEPVFQKYS